MLAGCVKDGEKWNLNGLIVTFWSFNPLVNRWASRKNELPVYLHLDFDSYEGDLMIKESD